MNKEIISNSRDNTCWLNAMQHFYWVMNSIASLSRYPKKNISLFREEAIFVYWTLLFIAAAWAIQKICTSLFYAPTCPPSPPPPKQNNKTQLHVLSILFSGGCRRFLEPWENNKIHTNWKYQPLTSSSQKFNDSIFELKFQREERQVGCLKAHLFRSWTRFTVFQINYMQRA